MKNKTVKLITIIVIILIMIDQISKILVSKYLTEPFGNDNFKLEISYNSGMALGLNEGNVKNIIISIFVLAIVISFVKNQIERIDKKTAVAIALILGGATGNLIDRFFRGSILDFIKISIFPVFNLADAFVVCGWILIIIFLIMFSIKK